MEEQKLTVIPNNLVSLRAAWVTRDLFSQRRKKRKCREREREEELEQQEGEEAGEKVSKTTGLYHHL